MNCRSTLLPLPTVLPWAAGLASSAAVIASLRAKRKSARIQLSPILHLLSPLSSWPPSSSYGTMALPRSR